MATELFIASVIIRPTVNRIRWLRIIDSFIKKNEIPIAAEPGVEFLAFHANVNSLIQINDVGTIAGTVTSPQNNRWTFEDTDVRFLDGDTLNYWIYVQANSSTYTRLGHEAFDDGGKLFFIKLYKMTLELIFTQFFVSFVKYCCFYFLNNVGIFNFLDFRSICKIRYFFKNVQLTSW